MRTVKSVKPSKLMKKTGSFLTLDNLVGLVLAMLILFQYNVENEIKDILKTPGGMILSLVLLVVIFIFMNPIVGILYLIYLYECVKDTPLQPAIYKSTNKMKQTIMKALNNNGFMKEIDKVEHDIIRKMAPIVKKSENRNAKFVPSSDASIPYSKL